MSEPKIGGLSERLTAHAKARKALLEKFKPKPHVLAPVRATRAERKARDIEEVRARRAAKKEAARLAKEKPKEEARLAIENDEELQLQLKRKARKAAAKLCRSMW